MRLRFFTPLFLCVLVVLTAAPARSQNQPDDQQVIDEFIRTRGSEFATRKDLNRPKKTKPAPTGASKTAKPRPKNPAPTKKPASDGAQPDSDAEQEDAAAAAPVSPSRLGLGYTIFRDKLSDKPGTDELIAVEPNHVFNEGDQLLLSLEANADGYLYIFNTENDSKPDMLYPNGRLDRGRNNISAHTRELYPAKERLQIVGGPAAEKLYVIFSREPLPGVPTSEELLKLCAVESDDCDWYPTHAQWEKIKALAAGTQAVEAKNSEPAKVEVRVPSGALVRGIKVRPKALVPAVVRMSASPEATVLMAVIELTHQ